MLLFVYGSLRLPVIRNKILGREAETQPAALNGYVKVCGQDCLTLIRGNGTVHGVVFEVQPEEMDAIDNWENFPTYQAFPVDVEVNGRMVRAHSYVMPTPPTFNEQVDDDFISPIPVDELLKIIESRLIGNKDNVPE